MAAGLRGQEADRERLLELRQDELVGCLLAERLPELGSELWVDAVPADA